tara:strand:- start:95 stop:310 length:216 start_codon:yes stop_codon:yes gene_type:complete
MEDLAKYIIYIGFFIILAGVSIYIFGNYLGWFGKTPLDFSYKSENVRIYFPFGSMLIISIIITFLLNLFKQ